MDFVLTPNLVWQLAALELLFCVFCAIGLLLLVKKNKPLIWVLIIGASLATAYLILIWRSQLAWWGIQGDEIFVTAFLAKVAAGYFFNDFFYANLPPFYPPLYFWLVGGLGYIFGLNGVKSAQLGVLLTLAGLPLVVYLWQKFFWQKYEQAPKPWQFAIVAGAVFVVSDWTAVILKPYEFASAILTVFWTGFFLFDLISNRINLRKAVLYGLSAGMLAMVFYFWFLQVAIAIFLFLAFSKFNRKYVYLNLIIVGIVAVIVSLPYFGPLAYSYLKYGSENWQLGFFIPEYLDFFAPFYSFGATGVVALGGMVTLAWKYKNNFIKALASLVVATYFWQIANAVTIIYFEVPFLPNKPFLFLTSASLAVAFGYGLSELLMNVKLRRRSWLLYILWLAFAAQSLFGLFIFDEVVQKQIVENKKPLAEEYRNLINDLSKVPNVSDQTILATQMPQIAAFIPLNYYVSYNAHFSHPAAHFSSRYEFVKRLSAMPTAELFYQELVNSPFEEIDSLLFYKTDDYYPVYFWVDDYPRGAREVEVKIPTSLIDSRYFATVFEDKRFIFYQIKR